MLAKCPFVIVLFGFYVLALAELQHTAITNKKPEMLKSTFFSVPTPCVLCVFKMIVISIVVLYVWLSFSKPGTALFIERAKKYKCIKMKSIPKKKKMCWLHMQTATDPVK